MSEAEFEGGEDEGTDEPAAAPKPPKKAKRPPTLGSSATPTAPGFHRESDQADDVWDEICVWLPSHNLAPNNVAIQVKRLTPPGPGGMQMPAGDFGGDAVAPTENRGPGSALVDYMIRYVHLPTMQAAATYQMRFRHKSTGVPIAIGNLALPDRQTCLNMLNAQIDASQAMGPGVGAGAIPRAPQMAPTQQWQRPEQAPQPPPWQMPPPGYGAAPQQPSMPPEAWAMMQSMMERAFTAGQQGQQMPQVAASPPAGVAAPINEAAMAERITASVLMALQKVPGIGAPPIVAPPPPPLTSAATIGAAVEGLASRLMGNMIKAAEANVESSFKQAMGMGAPPAAAEEPSADEAPAPEKPEDLLPWQAAPTGVNWQNGSPVIFAKMKPKEDGSEPTILEQATAFGMNNPVALEKGMELISGLGAALKDYLQRPSPGMAQVVRRIPQAAQDAGVGWLPPSAPGEPSGGNAPPTPAAPAGGGWAP